MKKGKYVITKHSPILFIQGIKHSEIDSNACSTGFFHLIEDPKSDEEFRVVCHSMSSVLGSGFDFLVFVFTPTLLPVVRFNKDVHLLCNNYPFQIKQ